MKDIKFRKVRGEHAGGMMMETDSMLPSIYLPLEAIPQAKDWKVGEEYTIVIKAKQSMLNEKNVSFNVLAVGVPGDSKKRAQRYKIEEPEEDY